MTIQKVSNQEVVISGTWNSASAYNGVIIDIRDLSSNINSDLLDLRLNGITQANITKGGMINTTSSVSALGTIYANTISATTYLNAAGGTPGGANTQVQFNNNGTFSGTSGFTYDNATTTLTAPVVSATTYNNIGPSVASYVAATSYGTLYTMVRGLVYP